MHLKESKLKNVLQKSGLITDETFVSAREESIRSGQSLVNVLIGRGDLPEDYATELFSQELKLKTVDLRKVVIPPEVLEMIPEAYAKTRNVVLFEYDAEKKLAKLAMADPLDYNTIEFLREKFGAWTEPYLAAPASLKFGLKQYKKKIGEEFNKIIAENIEKSFSVIGEPDIAKMAEAVPIVAILDSVIEHAVSLGASDIHFEPLLKEVLIRFRIDGIMQEVLSLPKVIAPILVARVKVLTNLLIDEHRMPQDGRMKFEMEEGNVDIRVNIMPVFYGEKVEMRILKSSNRPYTLEELGLSTGDAQTIMKEIEKPHGMILVTGPTGHGKTTTLYAILHLLNSPKVNITTIEDPIEYEVPRINQTQVNVKAGITFANGLRSLLRQNPDIIMIGEIRDNETVDISIHAALTGHLVLSSLHTNDAPSALPRFVDMGAQPFLLASTLNVVIAQRLVRRICSSCVESYTTTPEMKKLVAAQLAVTTGVKPKSVPNRLFRGKGCRVCSNTGFRGQIGVFEVFCMSDALRELVLKLSPVNEIRKQATAEGMKGMFVNGLEKVEKGITTIEEVLRVIRE
ncbi:MAG: GspE/PulE family protein [Candidatus Liptonbacteria bacterium]